MLNECTALQFLVEDPSRGDVRVERSWCCFENVQAVNILDLFSISMSIAACHWFASGASSASRIVHGSGVDGVASNAPKASNAPAPSVWRTRPGRVERVGVMVDSADILRHVVIRVGLDGIWPVGSSVSVVVGFGARVW